MAALKTLLFLVFVSVIKVDAATFRNVLFPIAGLFNNNSLTSSRLAFEKLGVTIKNSRSKVYHGRMIYPNVLDSYSTSLEVCENTSNYKEIVALIDGRPTEGYCDITCLLCNRLNILHLSLGWEPTETMSKDLFTFSYYPPPSLVSKAFATLIQELDWDKFTIFYEDDSSFIRLQEVIDTWPHKKFPITYRQLIPGGDNRETFKEVFHVERLSHHVMDCEVQNLVLYMEQILEVVNAIQYQNFILTNLDSHTLDFRRVPEFLANVSTMYMTTPDPTRWWDFGIDPKTGDRMETALAVDALTHLEKAIRKMVIEDEQALADSEDAPPDYNAIPALCYQESADGYSPWPWGEKLRQALITTQIDGFTGNTEFDEEGQRTNFMLYYSKLNYDSEFVHAGIWRSKTDILTTENTIADNSMTQKAGVIRVISRNQLPYFEVKTYENGTQEPRGYAVDLVNAIFDSINNEEKTNFVVQYRLVADGNYGNPIEGTKKWDGIVGELMEHKADLGICDLSITSDRNSVVDFSTPFMSTGISMLFRERDPVDPDMFSFINPLSLDVWLYLATTYIIVSYVLLLCSRMSHDDWVNPHPCNQNPESYQNIWSLYNCMWLTMGTIMTQGCDILPRGLGSRWIAGMWYFFAMIVTASYTANMSTFLSNSRRTSDIANVKQLVEQNKISYGAVLNSSTSKFFQFSNESVYQKIYQVMDTTKPTVFTSSNDEGVDRVLRSKGNYAFFMESTAIKYYIEKHCKLKMVGSPLDSKAYGIAMPKSFPHKMLVDRAILSLQEKGILTNLTKIWWKEKNEHDESCEDKVDEDDNGLQMKNTGGIFLVLGVGGILGLFVAIIDFLLHAQKISVKERVTFKEAVLSEWRASLNPRTLAKLTAPPRSAAASTASSSSPRRERSHSRAVSVLRAASSFINFDEIY